MRCSAAVQRIRTNPASAVDAGRPPRRAAPRPRTSQPHSAPASTRPSRRDGDALDALIADRGDVDHRVGKTFGREERLSYFRALLAAAHDPRRVTSRSPYSATRSRFRGGPSPRADSAADAGRRGVPDRRAVRDRSGSGRSAVRRPICSRPIASEMPSRGCTNAMPSIFLTVARARAPPRSRARSRRCSARPIPTSSGPPSHSTCAMPITARSAGGPRTESSRSCARCARCAVRCRRRDDTIEVLAAREDALLVRRTVAGELSGAGDRYRRRPIVLWRFGADGRVSHWEQFDGDQRDQALARFDELVAPPLPRACSTPRPPRPSIASTAPGRAAAGTPWLRSTRPSSATAIDAR